MLCDILSVLENVILFDRMLLGVYFFDRIVIFSLCVIVLCRWCFVLCGIWGIVFLSFGLVVVLFMIFIFVDMGNSCYVFVE